MRHHRTGTKRSRHPGAGDLELCYQALLLPEHPDRFPFALTASPGSPTEEPMRILASLAAGQELGSARTSSSSRGTLTADPGGEGYCQFLPRPPSEA